jgi:hypothetical protein
LKCIHRSFRVLVCGSLSLFAQTACSGRARAEQRPVLQSPHTEESELIVGLKALYVSEHAEAQRERGAGIGAFVETTLLEHLLELELGFVGVFPEESAAQLAFEPLLKVTFNVFKRLDPYLGLGPIVLWGAESPHFRGGGQLTLGSYVWINTRFGFDLDFGAALMSGALGVSDELTIALGPVLRL